MADQLFVRRLGRYGPEDTLGHGGPTDIAQAYEEYRNGFRRHI
jgi:hypothetical protein